MQTTLLNAAIENAFREAGWYSGRTVQVSQAVLQSHPAYRVLNAFGGLTVGRSGPGEEVAKSEVEFGHFPTDEEDIAAWEAVLHTKFVCIGMLNDRHGRLWLGESGHLVSSSEIHRFVGLEGQDFTSGVEGLLKGRCSKPMLLAGQVGVMGWGQLFCAGDPGVLSPDSFGSS